MMGKLLISAAALALATTVAFADNNTKVPNLSADLGQTGTAEDKLDRMNSAFGTDYDTLGGMMSDHVKSYEDVGPGRSGLTPQSENANARAQ